MRVFLTRATEALGVNPVPGQVAAGHKASAIWPVARAGARRVIAQGRSAVYGRSGLVKTGEGALDSRLIPSAARMVADHTWRRSQARSRRRGCAGWSERLLTGKFVAAHMTSARGSSNLRAGGGFGGELRSASWREGFRAWVSG